MLIEFNPFANQLVQVRGFAKSAMPADVAPTEVVGHNEQDIRLGWRSWRVDRLRDIRQGQENRSKECGAYRCNDHKVLDVANAMSRSFCLLLTQRTCGCLRICSRRCVSCCTCSGRSP